MGRPIIIKSRSLQDLIPTQMISFLFNNTGLHNLRRRRRSVLRTEDSCRDLESTDVSLSSSEHGLDNIFQPSDKLTLFQAKALMSHLERELTKQKNAKAQVMEICKDDFSVAHARRDAGCRYGFLLSVNKMKKHERDCEVFDQAIECLETLLLVISTEVSQVEAIAELSGEQPSGLKLFLTAESLRTEIDCILADTHSRSFSAFDEDEELFRELKAVVPVALEE
eukprot:scaffold2069_cov187-Amphora_coffeaeformis.AAC.43